MLMPRIKKPVGAIKKIQVLVGTRDYSHRFAQVRSTCKQLYCHMSAPIEPELSYSKSKHSGDSIGFSGTMTSRSSSRSKAHVYS